MSDIPENDVTVVNPDNVEISEEQQVEISKAVDRILDERKVKRGGSIVFCVSCDARKRQLYKWHNSYICCDCRKILKNVGEEKFMKALMGEEAEEESS